MTADPYTPPKTQVTSADSLPQGAVDNPHVLWRQVCGLVFWLALFILPLGGPLALLVGLAIGGAIFADAWISGIYKRPGVKSVLNMSPMSWGILAVLLSIVGFPAYALNRDRLRTRRATNGFFIAALVMLILVLFSSVAVRMFA